MSMPQPPMQGSAAAQMGPALPTAACVVGTPVTPAPPVQVPVVVPHGLVSGQQVAFTAPDGQTVAVSVPEGVTAGSTLLVQYQPVQPTVTPPRPSTPAAAPQPAAAQPQPAPAVALPVPVATVAEDEDQRLACQRWWLYGLAWGACLCHPLAWLAPVLWLGLAAIYYCKPRQQRAQMPRQRGPALASLITCSVLFAVVVLAGLVAAALMIGQSIEVDKYHHHHPHNWQPPCGRHFGTFSFGGPPLNAAPGGLPESHVAEVRGPPGAFRGLALAHSVALTAAPSMEAR
uniref:Uncharacterized protein n=1 Tax=Alexandrium monilatum TaxID=311494 RepID=A0A7S4QZ42_9DINO